jgi:DUF177 domain-containing protein
MSAQTVIDSLEFARTGQILRGSLPVTVMERLHDGLDDTLGLVDFVVQGGHDARHRPTLSLEVSGVLHLKCQRCLGHLDHLLRFGTTLLLVSPAEAAGGRLDDEEGECIEASAQLDIASLVEDEIILSLPYSPRHPDGQCSPNRSPSTRDGYRSAFAKLETLKRNSN